MRKKTKVGIITLIVLFEISILICGIFSDSHMIKESSGNFFGNSVSINNDKIKEFMDLGINLLIGFLSIKQIGTVSAAVGDAAYCCIETMNNGICADYPSEEEAIANCGNDYYNHACSQFNEANSPCDSGYCYNEEYGTCSPSKRFKCIEDGGIFSTSTMSECRQAGCILGSNCFFETEKQCELDGGVWDSSLSDPECADYGLRLIKGACVYNDFDCDIITEQECKENGGTPYFKEVCSADEDCTYVGYLCSADELKNLGVTCEAQDYIGCADGRDEIFWFDSCGNMENIYSSDKEASYNNGEILSKEDSCGDDEGNAGSETCGNCLSPMTACSETKPGETHVKDGNFICKNLNCKKAIASGGTTKDRINGESWCVYEGSIEDGKAVVGSEHWLFTCTDGEIVHQAQDHSNQRATICMEHTVTENGKSYTTASMVPNEHQTCILLNSEYANDPEMLNRTCNEEYSCYIKNVDIDDYFKFSMCMPKYPKGPELKDDEGIDENLCVIANDYDCTVYYEKKVSLDHPTGYWSCVGNCQCEHQDFAIQMQDFCIGLGDCGSYVNYVKKGTDNVLIKKGEGASSPETIPSEISWEGYVSYAETDPDAFIDSKDTEEYFFELLKDVLGGADWEELQGGEVYANIVDKAKWIAGGLGLANWAGSHLFGAAYITATEVPIFAEGEYVIATGTGPSILACVGGVIAGFSVGAWAGTLLANKLERTGPAATTMVLSAGAAGAAIGYMIAACTGGGCSTPYTAIAILIIAAAVLSYIALTGIGKTEERYVDFTCRPWQAPTDDYDCSVCNNNPLMPCTKYRCEALGQTCHLFNDNQEEENPICDALPKENDAPVLHLTGISEGYKITDFDENKRAEISSDSGGCIQELTDVKIDFTTGEFAQCKWSFKQSTDYESMEENYPNDVYSFAKEHSLPINFPPLESLLDVYDIEGDISGFYGDATIYLRCIDGNNNPNIDEYMIKFCINDEPDRTAISHALTRTDPENGDSLKYGTPKQDVTFYLHKPAECRYSTQSGVAYDDMTGIMDCNTNIETGRELKGWPCTAEFENLVAGENKFYIRCKAQPWLEQEGKGSERAVNTADYEYKLRVSENELKIDSTLPSGEVTTGFEPISVELRVTTSGGINNGIATCSYKKGNYWIHLQNTDSKIHTQSGWTIMGGSYAVEIQCEDDAGNPASGEISFTVTVDKDAPLVARAYKDGSSLKLIINEEAKCYYSLSGCTFNLEDATSITSTFSTMHTISWNPSTTYYVKCEDKRENINSGCAIKINSGL